MIHHLIKFFFIVLFISTLNACSDNAKLQPLQADATILAFGDSLTYGTGTSKNKAYPAILETLINYRVINAGVPGEISKDGLARLPGLLKRHHPDIVIICHGGNDILRKLDLLITQNNIQQMINLARNNNSEVVLVGVPEFGLFLDSSPMYPVLAKENNVPIENNVVGDILGKNSLKSDHIHPNTTGYQLLAESISSLLQQSGAIKRQ
ncbi:MAG: arylesterase [Gammaproteobacteria bacterium]|nr:arylesterase [Gammaproteobacteria bacterium]